jgi:hypothetical protein
MDLLSPNQVLMCYHALVLFFRESSTKLDKLWTDESSQIAETFECIYSSGQSKIALLRSLRFVPDDAGLSQ